MHRQKKLLEKEEKVLEGKLCTTIFALPKTICRVRLRVRTSPFHGEDTGSNPVRGTKKRSSDRFFHFRSVLSHDAYPEYPHPETPFLSSDF
jgi:hypothetical protein